MTDRGMIDRGVRDWYKDAIIYQLHVKAFCDANNDGVGDLQGLIDKLDYIKSLGVTALWLLPFYPSPLRDDGYDIAEYRGVHPSYGTLKDFRRLVRKCHERGIRVITELVINHTSDQHPWFQRARRAPKGSAQRNFYVWSDTDQAYSGTRIIFCDTESSNWAWDPVAGQYYWHRFYSHQPDLNFDNPQVLKKILGVLHFWLRMGVDGMRLDAVPYLVEREGTTNENLPQTHAILKQIRAEVEAHYPDRMLLAEANQWPEDTAEYFGQGDECHVALNFPLMPRIYMALAQEDRHPITDILRQSPDLPEGCQWGLFLRNHDELTLEMVTDQERDYLWDVYATDRRMRLNLGIRRRLTPLMERDRRRIELMHCLLLSLPGTPVLYYGDEIGMGDNIYLGDRDGVRTPMQWTPDRNAGFSRANPAQLYLPPNQDPVYGYGALNVESQEDDRSSLLNWIKRVLRVRQSWRAFGRGSLTFLYPGNRKIFAVLREHGDETILCVANLARTAQAVELDLARYSGRVPVELVDHTAFPPVGELSYLLTLPGYAFYWFALTKEADMPSWHIEVPQTMPDFLTLVLRRDMLELVQGKNKTMLEREVLPVFLARRRWFAGKDRPLDAVTIQDFARLDQATGSGRSLLLDVRVRQGELTQDYQLPLTIAWDEEALRPQSPTLPYTLAKARRAGTVGAVLDATAEPTFARGLLSAMREETPGDERLRGEAYGAITAAGFGKTASVRAIEVEQSNTSLVVGEQVVVKLYRRLSAGINPELEMARYLTHEAHYANVPALLGSLALSAPNGETTTLAIAQTMLFNEGDGWGVITNHLDGELEARIFERERGEPSQPWSEDLNLALIERLGQRTGELHRALARDTADRAFAPEPVERTDLERWRQAARRQIAAALDTLEQRAGYLAEDTAPRAGALAARRDETLARVDTLAHALTDVIAGAMKTRMHGDFHLGQVLVAERDFYVIDFEGEPGKPLAERRAKGSALRDVAGMLRSFDYAAWAAARQVAERFPDADSAALADALAWRDAASARFLTAYRRALGDCGVWPTQETAGDCLVELFALEKAAYEIAYEAANRPNWVAIPVAGLERMLAAGTAPSRG